MRTFKEFVEVSENYHDILNDCAQIVLDKEIDPKSLNELADIYLEFNPLALAGGIGGSMVAGPAGAIAGGVAGQKAGQAVGNWFKGGQANKIAPAFQQAKDATNKLIAALTGASQKVPQASDLLQNAKTMSQSLQKVEPQIAVIDKSLSKTHDIEAKQSGGIAQKLQGAKSKGILGKMARGIGGALGKSGTLSKKHGVRGAIAGVGDKLAAWGKRHPILAKGLQAGGAVAAGAMLGSMAGTGGAAADAGADGGGGVSGQEIETMASDLENRGDVPAGTKIPTPDDVASWEADADKLSKYGLGDEQPTDLDKLKVGSGEGPPPETAASKYLSGGEEGTRLSMNDPETFKNMSPEEYADHDLARRRMLANTQGKDLADIPTQSQDDTIAQAARNQQRAAGTDVRGRARDLLNRRR